MSERINCEVFQVRAGTYRLSRERGLAVTEHEGHRFIDPQLESHYTTSLGPAEPKNLKIELSKTDPPEIKDGLVTSFSIARDALLKSNEIRRYRAFRPTEQAVGQVALVSVVNHDGSTILPHLLRNQSNTIPITFYRHKHSWQKEDDLYNPYVSLMFVPPESRFEVAHDVGSEFNSIVKDFVFSYQPDSEEGLVFATEMRPFGKPDDRSSDEGGSDREPRHPILPSLSGMAVEPEPETDDLEQADAVMPFRETG